jgi:gliding motility-associated-like protein
LSITQAQIGSCISALSLTENIIVNTLPTVTSLTTNSPICQTEDAIFTITGTPNATVTYSVNGAANSTITLGASGTAVVTIANASSNATINLSNINEGICNVLLTNTSTVVVNLSPSIPTLTAIAESVCIGEDVVFNVSGSANATISYTINGGANQTLVLDGAGNGVITILAATITTLVELQDVMEGFCTLTLAVSEDVIVETCTIQKGISPNNDGRNDNFDLSGYNVSKLEIFNRYGTIVYSKNNYEDEWYGQSDNGNELPDGTYYYVIKFTDIETKTGWIYINREQ